MAKPRSYLAFLVSRPAIEKRYMPKTNQQIKEEIAHRVEVNAKMARLRHELQNSSAPWYQQLRIYGLIMLFLVMLFMGMDAIENDEFYGGLFFLGVACWIAFYSGWRLESWSKHRSDRV